MALYIAQIVTIVRHKKFHNSFYALFVMRAIPDLLFVLNSFYGQRLPFIFGVLYPIYSKFPNWMLAMFYYLNGHTFQANILGTTFILLNRLTAIAMPIKLEKIWRKFLPFITIFVYFVPTFSY
uniref:Serpentine receptor class gamma n=1 Tax=Globodera pallida TaxID=36090 RepID=A0A183CJJ6_GLOPA